MDEKQISENILKNRDFCIAFTLNPEYEEIKLSNKYVTNEKSGKRIPLRLSENIFYDKFIKLFFNP